MCSRRVHNFPNNALEPSNLQETIRFYIRIVPDLQSKDLGILTWDFPSWSGISQVLGNLEVGKKLGIPNLFFPPGNSDMYAYGTFKEMEGATFLKKSLKKMEGSPTFFKESLSKKFSNHPLHRCTGEKKTIHKNTPNLDDVILLP